MAPAKERRQSPQKGVTPRQDDAQGDFAVVGGVCLSGGHHGAVALVGENSQGDQRNDAYRVKRALRLLCGCVIHTLAQRAPQSTHHLSGMHAQIRSVVHLIGP